MDDAEEVDESAIEGTQEGNGEDVLVVWDWTR